MTFGQLPSNARLTGDCNGNSVVLAFSGRNSLSIDVIQGLDSNPVLKQFLILSAFSLCYQVCFARPRTSCNFLLSLALAKNARA
jgi:hypothetical protein